MKLDAALASVAVGIALSMVTAAQGVAAASTGSGLYKPGASFRDCSNCPEMIVVPAGEATVHWRPELVGPRVDFPADPNAPLLSRDVKFEKPFAVGAYDVTRDEYAVFMRERGRSSRLGCYIWSGDQWTDGPDNSWDNPGFSQTGRDPVVCVNWEDAQAYIDWLNERVTHQRGGSGNSGVAPYRLPTWEEAAYFASAGAASAYFWGNKPGRNRANYGADLCRPCEPARQGVDRWFYTSPAGAFPPNAFGLYDIAGNVWQWTDSCSPIDRRRAPNCLYAMKFPGIGLLVGGSWLDSPDHLKLSEYHGNDPANRNHATGFRVVKDVN